MLVTLCASAAAAPIIKANRLNPHPSLVIAPLLLNSLVTLSPDSLRHQDNVQSQWRTQQSGRQVPGPHIGAFLYGEGRNQWDGAEPTSAPLSRFQPPTCAIMLGFPLRTPTICIGVWG